jgi:hypothetical protein
MKFLLQILFLFLTWFINLDATPVFLKVVLPSYEHIASKTENEKEESGVKNGVQNFARSSIEDKNSSILNPLRQSYVKSRIARAKDAKVASTAGKWLDDLDVLLGAGTKTKINGWINNGLSESKLQTAFANTTDKAGLLNKLETSKSIYHQRVHIADWDNIPGIVKSNLSYNGLSAGKTYSAWNNPALDLPLDEAKNFVNATVVELPEGTKIYRVTGGNKAGAYWTIQKPNSVGDVIGGTAVQPAWNDFSKIYIYEVPQGQILKVWQGTTARQPIADGILNPHLPGGDQQLFIPQILRDQNFSNAVTPIPLPWQSK